VGACSHRALPVFTELYIHCPSGGIGTLSGRETNLFPLRATVERLVSVRPIQNHVELARRSAGIASNQAV
jgi:hypothetical protein